MKIQDIIQLVNQATQCIDNIEKGAIGYQGYGFVFDESISIYGSSRVYSLGSTRSLINDWEMNKITESEDLSLYGDTSYDIRLIGALKTLVPDLYFDTDELLFDICMFVKTPEGKQFPATLYYGPTGLAMGGWRSYEEEANNQFFPYKSFINFCPFDFSQNELEPLGEALELALFKVPISDFYAVHLRDIDYCLMGYKNGKTFIISLEDSYTEEDVNKLLTRVNFN